jgi:hypothetical protein
VKVRALGNSGNHKIAELPPGLAGKLGDDYESIAQALPDIDKQLELVRTYTNAWRQG